MAKDNRDLTTMTHAERVALAAHWLQFHDPYTAAWITTKAAQEPPEAVAAEEFRKSVLRMVWEIHFPYRRRTTAARLIAQAWANLPDDAAEAMPGSLHEMLYRLHAQGFRPFAWRKITDDLDASLD